MNQQRDKFLTETMGACWHGWEWFNHHKHIYKYCKTDAIYSNYARLEIDAQHLPLDFSTWEGFGKLWEWATKQDWWESFDDFLDCLYTKEHWCNPDRFADVVYEFLKEN